MSGIDRQKLLAAVGAKSGCDIAIIGKGKSIDHIVPAALEGLIIINANDSESIVPGDIGVFHHGWVLDRFEVVAPRCRVYVTDREMPKGVDVIPARYASPSEDSNLFISRFFDPTTIWIEQAAVISCLRVANELALALGRRKRVYLLGFDFDLENGFSSHVENGFHGADDAYVERMIKRQEVFLMRLMEERDNLFIDIAHIGKRPYSTLTVEAFNALRSPGPLSTVRSKRADVTGQATIVAEITTNHFGDRDRLLAMIRLAKESGADYVKLQKRDVDTFYDAATLAKPYRSPFGKTYGDYRRALELSCEDFEVVDEYCKKIGIAWFASVLDESSYEFIKSFNPSLIKLPSTISEKKSFLARVAEDWCGGVVISTGMTDVEYERFIISRFSKADRIYLLQCTSAYPAPENETGIGVIRHYRDLAKIDPRIIPGYSSHDMGSLCSQLAIAAGARMIEKHVKLGSVKWAHFDEVALDLATGEFASFVADVRRAERIAGCEDKIIFQSEHHKY